MAQILYSAPSGLTSIAASTTQVMIQLATGSTITNTITQLVVGMDGTSAGATAIPAKIQLVRETGASSAGSSVTPLILTDKALRAANTTARKNDTSDGSSPTILDEWLMPPTGLLEIQDPLGREVGMSVSDFLALRIVTQSGMTTCNYSASLRWVE